MKLSRLERAEQLMGLAHFLGRSLEEVFRHNGEDREFYELVQHLVDDRQFKTLLCIKRAEGYIIRALEGLTPDTSYLNDTLEQQLQQLQVLLQKIEREEHLRRDRDVLLSAVPELSTQGLSAWISGKAMG